VADEAAGIDLATTSRAQPHLQRREWTDLAQPGLCHDKPDGQQVSRAKPGTANPAPMHPTAHQNQEQADHDEHDKHHMQRQHRVGQHKPDGGRTLRLRHGRIGRYSPR